MSRTSKWALASLQTLAAPDATIQGHVSQKVRQQLNVEWSVPFALPPLRLTGWCMIQVDQYNNRYHTMRAMLVDGELWDVTEFIKPSMMMQTGGGFADLEDSAAKGQLRVTEDLLREMRDRGALGLAKANLDILKARSVGSNPIALETRDVTGASALLDDALRLARQENGDKVQDEPGAPDGFLQVQKAPAEATDGSTPSLLDPFGRPLTGKPGEPTTAVCPTLPTPTSAPSAPQGVLAPSPAPTVSSPSATRKQRA